MSAIGVMADLWWRRTVTPGAWDVGVISRVCDLVVGPKWFTRAGPDLYSDRVWSDQLVGLCSISSALKITRRAANCRRRGSRLMVGLGLCASGLVGGGVVFGVFRILDIAKPSIIGWCDRTLRGGLGVMADDVLAGLAAGLIGSVLTMFL